MSNNVRPALKSDYPAIARIQQECPEAAQWPVGDYSNYEVLLAFDDATPAGFLAWRKVADEEHEILNVGVSPAMRGKGIASALLQHLSSHATGDIFLEVAETNLPALALYHKNGWAQIDTRPGYYGRGSIAAIVMKKRS